MTERWFRLLLRFFPPDFRDEMGSSFVDTYRDRARAAAARSGVFGVAAVWLRALMDSVRNGLGERMKPAVSWRRSGNWGRDMELVVRRLRRAPLFALTILATLGIGLGAFAVVTTVVHKVLIAPLAYESPDDLYFVWRKYDWFELERGALAGTDLTALQEAGGVIEHAVALDDTRGTLTAGAGIDPMEVAVLLSSPNLFDVLGVKPMIGRGFAATEGGPNAPDLVVLTYDLWQRLGGQRSIVGSQVRLNDEPFTVIGVMPERFEFLRQGSLSQSDRPDVFVTIRDVLAQTSPEAGSYAGFIRARPGTPSETVESAVAAVGRMIDERDFQGRGVKLFPVGMKADLISSVRPALVVLGFAGVFLVLVLMVNLATLLLARAAQREKEFAVSRALGANPLAIARATLLEGALLGLLGGVLGALAAYWVAQTLVALAPADLPRRDEIAVDWQIAAVVIGVGALLGLLAATAPAVWAARTNLATLLGSTNVRGGGGHGRMRRGMVVVQVALSLVLLSAGALVVRSFERLLRANPGFDASNVLTFRIPLPDSRYPEAGIAYDFQDRLTQELSALPGVTGVSAASTLPLAGDNSQTVARIPDAPGNTGVEEHDVLLVDYPFVRTGFFDVMRIRMLEGRAFDGARRDSAAELSEAVVDRTLARHFFPNGGALGARIPFAGDTLVVVGISEHVRFYDVHSDDRPQMFLRSDDWGWGSLSWVVRTERDPESLIPDVQRIVRAIDPQLAVAEPRTMRDIVNASISQPRVTAVLVGGFALGALLLAAMGLFGVVAGAVTRRRHELAIRLALGADHPRVLRQVLSEGALLVGIGLLLAVPGVWFAGRAIRGVLVGVSPYDPMTLALVALGIGAVAMLACWLPARRVLEIEPAGLLRQE